jgi:hypothetical protein
MLEVTLSRCVEAVRAGFKKIIKLQAPTQFNVVEGESVPNWISLDIHQSSFLSFKARQMARVSYFKRRETYFNSIMGGEKHSLIFNKRGWMEMDSL